MATAEQYNEQLAQLLSEATGTTITPGQLTPTAGSNRLSWGEIKRRLDLGIPINEGELLPTIPEGLSAQSFYALAGFDGGANLFTQPPFSTFEGSIANAPQSTTSVSELSPEQEASIIKSKSFNDTSPSAEELYTTSDAEGEAGTLSPIGYGPDMPFAAALSGAMPFGSILQSFAENNPMKTAASVIADFFSDKDPSEYEFEPYAALNSLEEATNAYNEGFISEAQLDAFKFGGPGKYYSDGTQASGRSREREAIGYAQAFGDTTVGPTQRTMDEILELNRQRLRDPANQNRSFLDALNPLKWNDQKADPDAHGLPTDLVAFDKESNIGMHANGSYYIGETGQTNVQMLSHSDGKSGSLGTPSAFVGPDGKAKMEATIANLKQQFANSQEKVTVGGEGGEEKDPDPIYPSVDVYPTPLGYDKDSPMPTTPAMTYGVFDSPQPTTAARTYGGSFNYPSVDVYPTSLGYDSPNPRTYGGLPTTDPRTYGGYFNYPSVDVYPTSLGYDSPQPTTDPRTYGGYFNYPSGDVYPTSLGYDSPQPTTAARTYGVFDSPQPTTDPSVYDPREFTPDAIREDNRAFSEEVPQGDDDASTGDDVGADFGMSVEGDEGTWMASGGRVGMQNGGMAMPQEGASADMANLGMINAPAAPPQQGGQQSVEDDIPREADEGDYILPYETVLLVGLKDLNRYAREAIDLAMKNNIDLTGTDLDPTDDVPIKVSNYEYHIPKVLVPFFGGGKKYLDKIREEGLALRKRLEEEKQPSAQEQQPQVPMQEAPPQMEPQVAPPPQMAQAAPAPQPPMMQRGGFVLSPDEKKQPTTEAMLEADTTQAQESSYNQMQALERTRKQAQQPPMVDPTGKIVQQGFAAPQGYKDGKMVEDPDLMIAVAAKTEPPMPDWANRALDPKTPVMMNEETGEPQTLGLITDKINDMFHVYPTIRMVGKDLKRYDADEALSITMKKKDSIKFKTEEEANSWSDKLVSQVSELRNLQNGQPDTPPTVEQMSPPMPEQVLTAMPQEEIAPMPEEEMQGFAQQQQPMIA